MRHNPPNKINIFLTYACSLCFQDKPNYAYIRNLFVHEGYHQDHLFGGCTMNDGTNNQSAVVRAGTTSGRGLDQENAQYIGGWMYVMHFSKHALLIANCLACALVIVVITA
jgi:hypothetical protein